MWEPKDGYDDVGKHCWFAVHSVTGAKSCPYSTYVDAVEACRRLNGSLT